MSFIFYSDIHFGSGLRLGPHRILEILDVQRQVFELARQTKSVIIFPGDLCHDKDQLHIPTWNKLVRLFLEYKDVPIFGIPGNHDWDNKEQKENSLFSIGEMSDNWMIFHKTINGIELGGKKVTFSPTYYTNTEQAKMDLLNSNDDIFIGHFGLCDIPISITGKLLKTGIGYEHIGNRFQWLILGHHHYPYTGKYENTNVLVCGSPLPLTFGETGVQHGCWMLDDWDSKIKFIPLKYPDFYIINHESDLGPHLVNSYVSIRNAELKDSVNKFNVKRAFTDYTFEQEEIEVAKPLEAFDLNILIDEYLKSVETDLDKGKLKEVIQNYL